MVGDKRCGGIEREVRVSEKRSRKGRVFIVGRWSEGESWGTAVGTKVATSSGATWIGVGGCKKDGCQAGRFFG